MIIKVKKLIKITLKKCFVIVPIFAFASYSYPNESFLEKTKPDYLLILAWNFADSIIKNNQNFIRSGGKFIIPLPNLQVI